MNLKLLIYLIAVCEGTPSHLEEGRVADAPFHMTQGAIKDVNERYGKSYTMQDLKDHKALRVGYVILYLRRYDALDTYENALRTYSGGKRGRNWRKADAYWKRGEDELNRITEAGLLPFILSR